MLTFNQIAMFLSASGSKENLGKAGVNDGTETFRFDGVHTVGYDQKIYFILPDGSNLELKEGYTLVKLP